MSINIRPLAGTEVDFAAEAQLDLGIQFPHPLSPHALCPRTVLLTGATGALGTYLLDELVKKTAATIYCLVRAEDAGAAGERLTSHLRRQGIWRDTLATRLRAVPGDLAQPLLGLGAGRFAELAAQTDVIYHSAGWINMALPYARLKPINVQGTQEILRLASTTRTKPLHFVSSIAVFYSDAHAGTEVLKESERPRYHASLKGGYSKSKWVADRLVADAQARGLPTCIYRPVRIMGHSRTGALSETSDLLPLLLKGCILLGKYPALDIEVPFVPVDYVSQAIVHLAGAASSWGRAFHFFSAAPPSWHELMASLQALGYPLEKVSYDLFWRELKGRRMQDAGEPIEQKNFFAKLILALTAPHFLFYKRPPFEAAYLGEGLRGTEISCPPIDHHLISTYVDYWTKTHYLPRPQELER